MSSQNTKRRLSTSQMLVITVVIDSTDYLSSSTAAIANCTVTVPAGLTLTLRGDPAIMYEDLAFVFEGTGRRQAQPSGGFLSDRVFAHPLQLACRQHGQRFHKPIK